MRPTAIVAAILVLGASPVALGAPQWELRGTVASGQQFAAVADGAVVHVVSEHYVQVDATGAVVVDEPDVADDRQGALDFYPAIAVGSDGAVHVVTRHGGDVENGHEIRYRRRAPGGGWDPEVIVGAPAPRNYVVGVAVSPANRVLVGVSRLLADIDSVIDLYEIEGGGASALGETPAGWLRPDNDFWLAHSGSALLLASGEPGPASPFHVAFAADGAGDVLAQWEATHAEHEAGAPRRGGPATHVDDAGSIHLVYGGEFTLHYARYDATGAIASAEVTAMTDLGAWHLSHGNGVVVASADGARVLVIGLQNLDGDQRAEDSDILWAESVDAGASFGPAEQLGATTHGGEGRMRPRLARIGETAMLLYYDPAADAIALATAAWDDEPSGDTSSDDGSADSSDGGTGDGGDDAITSGGASDGSTGPDPTTAGLPPGDDSRGAADSGCGCRGTDSPTTAAFLLFAFAFAPRSPRARSSATLSRRGHRS